MRVTEEKRRYPIFPGWLIVCVLAAAAELTAVIWLLLWALNAVSWLHIPLGIFSILTAVYIISRAGVAAYRMFWLMLIILLPSFGGVIFWLFGENRAAFFLRRKYERGQALHSRYSTQRPETLTAMEAEDRRSAATARYISSRGGFPVWQNTAVSYHSVGAKQYEDIIPALEKAEKYIFLEYFIIQQGDVWNSILDVLYRKAKQGVDVRVMYDGFGCAVKLPHSYDRRLEAMGIKCVVFNRLSPLLTAAQSIRDHRKMIVIDGEIGFTGGLNLADEYMDKRRRFGFWKDSGLMLRGGAVNSLTLMFLELWNSYRPTDHDFDAFLPAGAEGICEDGFVQPYCQCPWSKERLAATVYMELLSQAKDYVYIFTPYLSVSEELQQAICAAAKRGVDVRIVIPGVPDKPIAFRITHSYARQLMKAGVRFYEYTPGFLHSKSFVVDDTLAVVGSVNLEFRSLFLHLENGVFLDRCAAVMDVKQDALATFAESREIIYGDLRPGVFGAAADAVLRLLAPMF